jgi:hypothetical protein
MQERRNIKILERRKEEMKDRWRKGRRIKEMKESRKTKIKERGS